jgi:hypothetical protein
MLCIFSSRNKTTMFNYFVLYNRSARLLAFSLILFSCSALAEEGGGGHVAPGGVATLIDAAPTTPGWIVEPIFVHYAGQFDVTKQLPIAGKISLGLDAKVDTLTLGGLYTFEKKVWGGFYSAGVFAPYAWMDIEGHVNQRDVRDVVNGFGDITLIPLMLGWKNNVWKTTASLSVYAPTGDYTAGKLANLGLNYWTADPTLGLTYNNGETGLNFNVFSGITFNSENKATDYHSGSMFHIESSIHQLFPAGTGYVALGVEAFLLQQVTADSGAGARRDFKGRTAGVGPVFNYILPSGKDNWIFEAKWLPELSTENRLKGDYFWLKIVYQFQ